MSLVPTAAEIALLRTRPHSTRLGLGVYKPSVMLACRVNNPSAAKGDIVIPYASVSQGSYTNVLPGMTLYVGTSSKNKGRVRVRSITATQITVAENALEWNNWIYITIVKYFEPWGMYTRLVLNAAVDAVFYKDYDIAYTDQNKKFDPVPIMGPNRAGIFAPPYGGGPGKQGGVLTFYFDGSASYDLNSGGTITSYAWTFEGSSTTPTSTLATPGGVAFDAQGYFMVTLTVTNNLGKTATARRFVCAYNPADANFSGMIRTITNWGIETLSGSYEGGGWEGRLWMRQLADDTEIVDGALIVVFANALPNLFSEKYGNTFANIGGAYDKCETIVFVGYVRDGSVVVDPQTSIVTFGVTSVTGRMSSLTTFGASIISKKDPALDTTNEPAWAQVLNMTPDIAINHFLRWHTTIYTVADIMRTYDDSQVKYADFERGSIYNAWDQFTLSSILSHVVCDRQGRVWTERKIDLVATGDRGTTGIKTIINLTRVDWRDKIEVIQRREIAVSYVFVGGFYYSGPDADTSQAIISSAPGLVPYNEGNPAELNGLILPSQGDSNTLAGNVLANFNKEFPAVKIPIAGNYRIFDIGPQVRVTLSIGAADSYLNEDLTLYYFIPRTVEFRYLNEQQTLLVDITCEQESDGPAGVTGPYPQDPVEGCDPATEDCSNPGDPCPSPPCTPNPCDSGNCGPIPTDGSLVYVVTSAKVARSRNFLVSSPNWTNVTGAITGTIIAFILDPYVPGSVACIVTTSTVYRTINLDSASPTWTSILTAATVNTAIGKTTVTFEGISGTIAQADKIYVSWKYNNGGSDNGIGASVTSNAGVSWIHTVIETNIPSIAGGLLFNVKRIIGGLISANTSYCIQGPAQGPSGVNRRRLYKTTNGGSSWSVLYEFSPLSGFHDFDMCYESAALAETYQYILYGGGSLLRSTNSGSSFTDLGVIEAPGGASGGLHRIIMNIATANRLNMMFVRETTSTTNLVKIWKTLDGGGSFSAIATWLSGNHNVNSGDPASCGVTALGRWPYDPNRCFWLEADASELGAGTPRIGYSVDGMVTRLNKWGDYASTVAATLSTPINIIPVWVS